MQQQDRESGPAFKATTGFVFFLARMLAMSVEVFLHDTRTFGVRYLGVQAAIAVICLLVYAGLYAGTPGGDVTAFFVAWTVFLIVVARVGSVKRERSGTFEHSYYNGVPRILRLFPKMEEMTVKANVEPLMVLVAAITVMPLSESLGKYLIFAGASLSLTARMAVQRERTRRLDLNDAFMESRRDAEWFRDSRNE